MKIFSFEKLNVWQKARKLSVNIYKITKAFPSDERFGSISQMRRCAASISSNIAEGRERYAQKDKVRFMEIAYSTSLELLNQSIRSNDLELLEEEDHKFIVH